MTSTVLLLAQAFLMGLLQLGDTAHRLQSSTVELTYEGADVKDGGMPGNLQLTFSNISLTLSRADDLDPDAGLYTMTTDTDGSLLYRKETVGKAENVAYYQDLSSQASFRVTRSHQLAAGRPELQFKGVFSHQSVRHLLYKEERVARDVTSFTASSHARGDVYRLEVQGQRSPHSPDNVKASKTAMSLDSGNQGKAVYYIDLVAVVDYKAYSRFLDDAVNRTVALQNTLEYYTLVIAGVDLLYQGITSTDYSIRVGLSKVVVAEEASASPFTENIVTDEIVDGGEALNSFAQFLAGNGRSLVSPYDTAMLFSGYDLKDDKKWIVEDLLGIAKVGAVCKTDGTSSSVVEDRGGFQCIDTAAHELGHSLNAQHDGEGNGCGFDEHNIMASEATSDRDRRNTNPWKFSACSLDYFSEFFTRLLKTSYGATCLTGKLTKDSNLPSLNGSLPGLKYRADAQCKMLLGHKSTDCSSSAGFNYDQDPSRYCKSLWCTNSGTSLCHEFEPVPGTPCGEEKLCINGECVPHPLAPKQEQNWGKEQCVLKNDASINCTHQVQSHPWMCYSKVFKRHCCESCVDIYRPIQDCEFGDWKSHCGPSDCNGTPLELWQCCGTCKYGHPITTTSLPTPPTTSSPTSPPTSSVTPSRSGNSQGPPATATSGSPTNVSEAFGGGFSDCNGTPLELWQCCGTCKYGHPIPATSPSPASLTASNVGQSSAASPQEPSSTVTSDSKRKASATDASNPVKDTNVWMIVSFILGAIILLFGLYKFVSCLKAKGLMTCKRRGLNVNISTISGKDDNDRYVLLSEDLL